MQTASLQFEHETQQASPSTYLSGHSVDLEIESLGLFNRGLRSVEIGLRLEQDISEPSEDWALFVLTAII